MGSCMYRRSSGIYVVRLAVPKRLRGALGRTEIHVSTELRELPAARIAALRILLREGLHKPPGHVLGADLIA